MENPHRDKCRRGALSILLAQVGLGQGVRGGGTRRGAAAADDVAEGQGRKLGADSGWFGTTRGSPHITIR